MLERARIKGFKSLYDTEISFPRLLVLFGPNASGKSNILDALQVLSRLSTERTVNQALSPPVRGHPAEQFTLPEEGLSGLHDQEEARFEIEVDVGPEHDEAGERVMDPLRYRVAIALTPPSGSLRVADEFLSRLSVQDRTPKHNPRLEVSGDQMIIRRRAQAGQPRRQLIDRNYTRLSDTRLSGEHYPELEHLRDELSQWRTYYLDPRIEMRKAQPPREVTDIGPNGKYLAPFLFRLKNQEQYSARFDAVVRTLKSVIPSIDSVDVDLDKRRGTLDIQIIQHGVPFSSRVVSEGTLRVLALCCIAVNPWPGSLVAFEEPENGVHPRRLEIVADLLDSLSQQADRQLIVTTHSPKFAGFMAAKQRRAPDRIQLMVCKNKHGRTETQPFDATGALWEDEEIREALTSPTEDGVFDAALMRGWIDG